MKILTISGYKSSELGIFSNNHKAVQYIQKAILKSVVPLIEEGLEWVIISGQLGTELWAAEVVQKLQEIFPNLQLGIFTPYENQEQNWNEQNKLYYEEILMLADHVDSISRKPYESPQQLIAKNVFLIEKSDACLLFYDPEKEGSPKYMYDIAKKKCEIGNYQLIQVTFDELQAIVDEETMYD
ncbi:DUF1273 domain-containing protein [Bacillus sp. RG28]|uniref:UPF0398 protein J5Y03_03115 n=1 Tax=Gottfriedia endophytica TaxID=2820819 RepID=A0A940SI62_9BACI|nr:DUF1273 domain-containing protein [Gottfriedia endophytica]MBP0724171.1 DUF1273 domain-containing protein [Gottfriedia endophytica]